MGFNSGRKGARRFSQPSSVTKFFTRNDVTVGTTSANAAIVAGVTPGIGELQSGIRIKADAANAEAVYVGPTPVGTTTGFKLSANEEVFIDIDAIDKIYLISAGGGETISFIAS
tara:strand:+ start:696 stop:1037 length:342 start_codon:yes stop_codon:yes gene_type:complete